MVLKPVSIDRRSQIDARRHILSEDICSLLFLQNHLCETPLYSASLRGHETVVKLICGLISSRSNRCGNSVLINESSDNSVTFCVESSDSIISAGDNSECSSNSRKSSEFHSSAKVSPFARSNHDSNSTSVEFPTAKPIDATAPPLCRADSKPADHSWKTFNSSRINVEKTTPVVQSLENLRELSVDIMPFFRQQCRTSNRFKDYLEVDFVSAAHLLQPQQAERPVDIGRNKDMSPKSLMREFSNLTIGEYSVKYVHRGAQPFVRGNSNCRTSAGGKAATAATAASGTPATTAATAAYTSPDTRNIGGDNNFSKNVYEQIDMLDSGFCSSPLDLLTQDDKGFSALHAAVLNRSEACVSALLLAGCSANHPDVYQQTPLHLAHRARNEEIIRLLLEYGASKTLKNITGHFPGEEEELKADKKGIRKKNKFKYRGKK